MELRTPAIASTVLSFVLIFTTVVDAEGGGTMISVGEPFVEFELEAHDGTTVSSSDLEGRPYLLFFYPKASTPG
jgi:peroxiredoxin Q/BCP